jgi:hypothetical protein
MTKVKLNNLHEWDAAIAEAKRMIVVLKKSIRSFEYFRDNGVQFPEPKKIHKYNKESNEHIRTTAKRKTNLG